MIINDSLLIKVSLLVSCIGIIGLIIISSQNTSSIALSSAIVAPIDSFVTINTSITSVEHKGNLTLFMLKDECVLPAVYFEKINLTTPINAMISGSITIYNGKRELIVESLII